MPLILLTLLSNHHPKQKLYAHQALAPHLPSVRSLGNLFSFLFQSLCLFQTSLTNGTCAFKARPCCSTNQNAIPFYAE